MLQLSAVTGVPNNTPVAVHPLLVQTVTLAGAVMVGRILSAGTALITTSAEGTEVHVPLVTVNV
jgi:hypothetical protein